jgi:hypothetical protein
MYDCGLRPVGARIASAESANFPVFSLLAGNFRGEGFARDCVLRHVVSSAENLWFFAPEMYKKAGFSCTCRSRYRSGEALSAATLTI